MYQLARLGLVLLGLYTIINAFPLMFIVGPLAVIGIAVSVIVLLLPGVILIAMNRRMAGAIFSTHEARSVELTDPEGFYVLGFALLGVWVAIQGLISAVTGVLVQIALLDALRVQPLATRFGPPVIQIIVGVSLFLGAKRLGRAFSRTPEGTEAN